MAQGKGIRPVVIGTAGHIDHGKSTLVRALTGVDPDRLKEEKERGMTIDLGFAPMSLSDGRTVGLVDVPGHEKFIRNMVAGATGIDLVALVVAADDGVMPQTREHLAILEMVGVKRGLIVLTKVDMVEAELVEMAAEDVLEFVEGTFLEGAEVHHVSAITGEGMDKLKATLEKMALSAEPRPSEGIFRMPVQRVFTLKGFGTVTTGIPLSGEIKIGEMVEILPGGKLAKVRGIHAYGKESKSARAGHSSALNLTDVDHQSVVRGAVIATPGYFRPVKMIAAKLQALSTLDRSITNRMIVRVHTGTSDSRGELVLLDKDEIRPGQEGLVQVRMDEPVITAPGDRFVVRLLSPVITLGGGTVLEESRHRLKRFKAFVIDELSRQEESLESKSQLLESMLARLGGSGADIETLAMALKMPNAEVLEILEELRKEGRVASPGKSDQWIHAEALEGEFADLTLALDRYFGTNPHRSRMDVRDLRKELGADKKHLAALLSDAQDNGLVEILGGGWLRSCDHESSLSEDLEPKREALLQALAKAGFQPPICADLATAIGTSDSDFQVIVEYCQDQNEARTIGEFVLSQASLDQAESSIIENCTKNTELNIPELRDALGTTRKYLIPLLEHFDLQGLTARSAGTRILKRR
ncbi:MAG: selenocysteine-specific translation elongation factor [Planctomycetota bacterium]|nr:selenocysteine-specific translation elongation factor [Planctomycetota bacterium]MDG2142341.1 selenocysteine-specific translation elongation factor [Planctomycetota bacterium]